MSEPALPDDLALWPEDPYELLAVERGSSPKDAKRNYTRLIRVFKPEHHPEHFRRLREAYEAVVRSIEFFSRFGITAEARAEAPDEPERPAPRVDEASLLWERACEGSEAEAYHGLQNLCTRGDRSLAICLRLYWLLSLDPGHDADRQPCDWLLEALRNFGVYGSALELYRREVDGEPAEALHARFDQLLSLELAPPVAAEIYAMRWLAARKLDRCDRIHADLAAARRKFFGGEEFQWLHLLKVAADAAAWSESDDRALWTALEDEIQQVSHLSTRYGEWFDQFEHLQQISLQWQNVRKRLRVDDWRRQKKMPPNEALLELVKKAWNAPLHVYRAALMDLLESMSSQPNAWLRCLDSYRDIYSAVFGAFTLILQQVEAQCEPAPPAPAFQVARMTTDFIAACEQYTDNFRERVVEFCCRTWIDPLEMVQAVLDNQVEWRSALDPEVLVRLVEDWPVRLLCLANRLFWQCP